jgi:hypothetical protein
MSGWRGEQQEGMITAAAPADDVYKGYVHKAPACTWHSQEHFTKLA